MLPKMSWNSFSKRQNCLVPHFLCMDWDGFRTKKPVFIQEGRVPAIFNRGHNFFKHSGSIGDKATENEVLLLEHDIPHSTFSNAVLDCLPEEGDKFYDTIQDKDRAERADFRDLDVCSGEKNSLTPLVMHLNKSNNLAPFFRSAFNHIWNLSEIALETELNMPDC